MDALTMESSVFNNLRIRLNADEVTCLVMWNDTDDADDADYKYKEVLGPFWEYAKYSRAGNWYIKAVLTKKIHPDCIKKFGNEMPLDRCALETKWVELDACGKIVNKMQVVITDGVYDDIPGKRPQAIGCDKMDFKVKSLSLGEDKLKFKFLDPPGFINHEKWYEPKTLMVSSSCFTSDDRQKLEDAMAQQVAMKKLLLNSRYGITTSPPGSNGYFDTDLARWLIGSVGADFDGDLVSIEKLREWTTREDIEEAEKDFEESRVKYFIHKRKGVKIMKKTDKTGPTVQEVFDTLTPLQRDTVYYLIGEAIKENTKGGAIMATNPTFKTLISEVIFEGPATVVMWADGTKTVVKAQHGEEVDREKGLALAMTKKFYGNDKNYFDRISMQVLGYNLRNLMKKRGMKAKDIAETMKENKVTVPMVELWMRGNGKINSNRIAKLAKILGVKEEALFAAKDKKPSRPRTKKTEE